MGKENSTDFIIFQYNHMNKGRMIDFIYKKIPSNPYSQNMGIDVLFIWDVFYYLNSKYSTFRQLMKTDQVKWLFSDKYCIDEYRYWVLALWKELRLPIDYQSRECVEFIYSLIK